MTDMTITVYTCNCVISGYCKHGQQIHGKVLGFTKATTPVTTAATDNPEASTEAERNASDAR